MSEPMQFHSRMEFRDWLSVNAASGGGIWLLISKPGVPKTVKADEALVEALCFGWIDGRIQSLDGKTYKKYFSARRAGSPWSEKNKALAVQPE